MTRTLRPLGDRVVVDVVDADEQTPGGLFVPEVAREKPQEAIVAEVGEGVEGNLKPGDVVLFGKYSGTEVTVDGETRLILRESDLIAVLEED